MNCDGIMKESWRNYYGIMEELLWNRWNDIIILIIIMITIVLLIIIVTIIIVVIVNQ